MSPEEMREFLAAQSAEMASSANRWFAGEKLKHEPSPSEAALHYIEVGGAADFRRRFNEAMNASILKTPERSPMS